ncbi:asparaginyl-tRNA synthetase [Mycena maculata]|uniref:asparagine--tRNA ligase n=1 Tax=Mycena maculata TaxID=230809 RepID=A0AAD7NLT5_9AGAR|nr:asparaginyl-tRNA synthetase [Mycena maculata]
MTLVHSAFRPSSSSLRAVGRPLSTAAARFRLPPTIRQILSSPGVDEKVVVTAWVKSIRKQKRIAFGVLSDGSSGVGLQAVFHEQLGERVKEITNGTSVRVRGNIVKSPGSGQEKELHVEEVEILGACDPDTYPIQKQALTPEYLRDNIHLRARTDAIASMVRLRGRLMRGLDRYFENQDFAYAHTPVLTSGDAEGGGEAFRIAAISSSQDPVRRDASPEIVDREFFTHPAYLTVSHQLHLEALSSALARVYTLSPCFRAERGVTRRHLAEFWMLEAEWGVAPTDDPRAQTVALCDFVEGVVKGVVGDASVIHGEDVNVLWRHREYDSVPEAEREKRREAMVSAVTTDAPWAKMTYSDAIHELLKADHEWTFPVIWGSALQSEHEKWLCETLVRGPLFVTDYPAGIKPFYMRANPPMAGENEVTMGCFDLLMPNVGELAGGSVREERLHVLQASMHNKGMDGEGDRYGWYGELRRFGGAPHVGFGMGFERLVAWVGGIENVRECVPMPRWAGRMLL